jgi:hypothetical protein
MLTPACLERLDQVYAQAVRTLDVSYTEPLERAYKLAYGGQITARVSQAKTWDVTGSQGTNESREMLGVTSNLG